MKTKQIILAAIIFLTGTALGKFALSNKEKLSADIHQNETVEEHWTCSMHPQIDMPEFGQCPICGMDLILKESNEDKEMEHSADSFKMSKNAVALANIETIIVGNTTESNTGKSQATLLVSGKINANDKKTAIQTAHFSGRIEGLYYKSEGEFVKRGSLIATIYSPELVTAQNELIEAIDIKSTQPKLYRAVRNKLKNWKISERQIQQIEQTKKVITNFNMYADVSGYISEISVEVGNHIKEGSKLFQVTDLSTVWASIDVYEKDIQFVKLGQEIMLKPNAFPNELIHAKIDFIDPILDTKTRTITIRATIDNKTKKLKPGMLLSGELVRQKTQSDNRTVRIPKTAVLWTGKRSVIYAKVAKEEPVFEMREINLGNESEEYYDVLSGVKMGDEIVVNGAFTVDAAAQILGKQSMMNKN